MIFLVLILIFYGTCEAAPHINGNRTPKLGEKIEMAQLKQPSTLRLMTFNTWNLGRNVNEGPKKIAKHIEFVNPDIVGIQVSSAICI
jgi:hypothetical protein